MIDDKVSLIVPFEELHAGLVPTKHTVSALGITNTDSGLAPHRSCPIHARPAPTRLLGMVATSCANCWQLPKLLEVTAPGLLNFRIALALPKPTQRFPSGSRAAELGKTCTPGMLHPVWPAGNVLFEGLPPRLKREVRSSDPLPLSPSGR